MHERDYGLLKKLALRFASGKDPDIFIEIVLKVDNLLLYTIHKLRKSKPYLRKVDIQDLYHDAIVGLYAALLNFKADEPGSKLIYKITRYVSNEIAKHNKRTNKVAFSFSVGDTAFQIHLHLSDMAQSGAYIDQIKDQLSEKTPPCRNLESEFIRKRFTQLIKEEVITFEEFTMLTMYYVDSMKYKNIAKQFGTSVTSVSRKIKNVLNRLRYEFRRRGWESGL